MRQSVTNDEAFVGLRSARTAPGLKVSVLTGGRDPHYAVPLICSLAAQSILVDVVGGDECRTNQLLGHPNVTLHNLHGSNAPDARLHEKIQRVFSAYVRLIRYAARTDSSIFHILWLNKLETLDRIVLVTYLKLLGKRILFTAHNVDAGERDGTASIVGRLTLRFMYRVIDHIFVHTVKMKDQLQRDFAVPRAKVTVIPYGLNTFVPESRLTRDEARQELGIGAEEKSLLFFGHIAQYKGLDYLLRALAVLKQKGRSDLRLIIAGRVKDRRSAAYHRQLVGLIDQCGLGNSILARSEFIPDRDIEVYFKAADVCVLPYTMIFQSGVLSLAYRFGLPVVASDVGSLREDVIDGRTGFICRPRDPEDLAAKLEQYFASDLFTDFERTSRDIRIFANDRYSWPDIAATTSAAYRASLSSRAA